MTDTDLNKERGPIEVRNRDIPILAEVLSIMQDIKQIERRREWQRERMYSISYHLTGMPGGGGSPKGLDGAFVLLSQIDEEHEQRCRDYAMQVRKADRILQGIESPTMRAIVELKYVWDEPDAEIRRRLHLTRRGLERARRCIEEAPCMAEVKWREKYVLTSDE